MLGLLRVIGVFCAVLTIAGCAATSAPTGSPPAADCAKGPFVQIGAPLSMALNYDIATSGNGRTIIGVEPDRDEATQRFVRVWNLDTAQPVSGRLPLGWLSYALSHDGRTAFTTDRKHVYVWDVTTSNLRWTLALDQTHLHGVAISPDGTELLA